MQGSVPVGWLMTASVKSNAMPATDGLCCPAANGLSLLSPWCVPELSLEKGPCVSKVACCQPDCMSACSSRIVLTTNSASKASQATDCHVYLSVK